MNEKTGLARSGAAFARRRWAELRVAIVIGSGMVIVYMPRAYAAVEMNLHELVTMTADVFSGWVIAGWLIVVFAGLAARRVDSLVPRIAAVVAAMVGLRLLVPMSLQVLDATRHTLGASTAALQLELVWSTILCAAATTVYLDRVARGRAADAALASLRREQQQVRRRLVEARLTVLQARVDPVLFFDMLGLVRDRYTVDPTAAETLLERLTTFLRAAMPRLRTAMSTVGEEVALARAYGDLLREAGHGASKIGVTLGRTVAEVPFPAGVLLPLLDALHRRPGDGAPVGSLHASRRADAVLIRLTGDAAPARPATDGVCRTLEDVYPDQASLRVEQLADGRWTIEVEVRPERASNAGAPAAAAREGGPGAPADARTRPRAPGGGGGRRSNRLRQEVAQCSCEARHV